MRCLVLLLVLHGTAWAGPRLELAGSACDLSAMTVETASTASVRVETATDAGGFVATISFDDGRKRVVRADSCAELADSAALIIEMALSERTVVDTPKEAPAEVVDTAPPVPLAPSGFDVVTAGAGTHASNGWHEQLIVGVRWKRAARSLGIELRAAPPDQQTISPMAHIDVWTSAVTVSPCVHAGQVSGCVTATGGLVEGVGYGLVDGERAFTPLLAGGLRLSWEHSLAGRYTLRLLVDGEAALTKTRFDVDHMPVWTSDRFTIWGGAGVISHFP